MSKKAIVHEVVVDEGVHGGGEDKSVDGIMVEAFADCAMLVSSVPRKILWDDESLFKNSKIQPVSNRVNPGLHHQFCLRLFNQPRQIEIFPRRDPSTTALEDQAVSPLIYESQGLL